MTKQTVNLDHFQQHLGYQFKDQSLLIQAVTHSSYHQDKKNIKQEDNQRLEFLGDRVLGLLTAEFLFQHNKTAQEGMMAIQLNELVCKKTCTLIAKKMRLDKILLLSSSEIMQGGRRKNTILADACEAILAAIYLDGGLRAVKQVYMTFWHEVFKTIKTIQKDVKSQLQDWTLKKNHQTPVYQVISKQGEDHHPIFKVRVSIFNGQYAEGVGRSKREAEYAAARALLKELHI